ncbi:MAG: CopG family ribbon-helix-helix protein [Planctomycetota bacterium]|jgi:metal-responsive CopG/Arc/MetJ family transcriptional regulator
MAASKVAISIDGELLAELDRLVAEKAFDSRSQAVQVAVREKIARLNRSRLAEQCAKLDPAFEQAMAEEGISGELAQWPEY